MRSTLSDVVEPDGGGFFWLGLYLVDLAYGGPEDGGWWFQAGTLVVDPDTYRDLKMAPSAHLRREDAEALRNQIEPKLAALNEGRPPIDASNSIGIYELRIIEAPNLPTYFPLTRPHYE